MISIELCLKFMISMQCIYKCERCEIVPSYKVGLKKQDFHFILKSYVLAA